MTYINDWNEVFMRGVYNISWKSKDPKTKIGAILVKDNIPIVQCFNGFPRLIRDDVRKYADRNLKRKMVAHAEANTIFLSARLGKNTYDATCYTQGIPCSNCAIALIQGGIKEIIVHKQWPNLTHSPEWVDSIELSNSLLKEAGIPIIVFDKILGLEGMLDGQIIKV